MSEGTTTVRIFFSWQKDLDQTLTTKAIRRALRDAASAIEEAEDVSIDLVEATSNSPGSPYIPYEIADKIKASSIFIGDITPVCTMASGKQCPNPNVTFELGTAATLLGWNRVIMLFNTVLAEMKDLPFDFDRHRISQFVVRPDPNRNSDLAGLRNLLVEAIATIIKTAPKTPRELEGMSEGETKRARDLGNIRWFLSNMNSAYLDAHVENMPDILDAEAIWVADGLTPITQSSDFRLYDGDIEQAMRGVQESLSETLAFDQFYRETASWRRQAFGRRLNDFADNREESEAYEAIKTARYELNRQLRTLMQLLHERYLEIDVNETNRKCAQSFLTAHKELFDDERSRLI
ncbi:nucleotide-binding protein [Pararhizobium sp. YC-54]|uniref:nucleotide-binding protein n=1 Tax=Pararhizobium sp. YC-54 TaxID=2986920 RepID=UPI0021F6AA7E|nr:nucleotide-binding protein [Pararhizobium sp. YC-54]MCV9999443.1 nucleotide-binding protein [Pararhizobium sp. YC-54]